MIIKVQKSNSINKHIGQILYRKCGGIQIYNHLIYDHLVKKPDYVSDLRKLDTLLHKIWSKVIL